MSITLDKVMLQTIIPHAKEENIDFYLAALNEQLEKFDINSPLRVCHFLAQIAHESGSFNFRTENLNYSAKALRAVFGKYFATDDDAESCARQPEKIANIVYASRMGNGDADSGEGWKYRGRGLIQLTGKDNYEQCGAAIGLPLADEPDQVAESADTAVAAACWFWKLRRLNEAADEDDVELITRRINGGTHGLEDRKEFLERAKKALGIS